MYQCTTQCVSLITPHNYRSGAVLGPRRRASQAALVRRCRSLPAAVSSSCASSGERRGRPAGRRALPTPTCAGPGERRGRLAGGRCRPRPVGWRGRLAGGPFLARPAPVLEGGEGGWPADPSDPDLRRSWRAESWWTCSESLSWRGGNERRCSPCDERGQSVV